MVALIQEFGTKHWSCIAAKLEGRTGKQVRMTVRMTERSTGVMVHQCVERTMVFIDLFWLVVLLEGLPLYV